MPAPTVVALIPARSGSNRIPDKNIRLLGGHPLIAYTVRAAVESGVFAAVVASTDSARYAEIAKLYGAEAPFLRPAAMAGSTSCDIDWVKDALARLAAAGRCYDCFAILRPTSPFRTAETIRRAWAEFTADGKADSLRAVEKCAQHPAKMWTLSEGRMTPVMANPDPRGTPWHSTPYQALPEIYAQNASLEIAWTRVALEKNSIAGESVRPFFTSGWEGFDINVPEDWMTAERLVEERMTELPRV